MHPCRRRVPVMLSLCVQSASRLTIIPTFRSRFCRRAVLTFDAGTTVGPYEILSHLGAGGQGEVYKARDKRLNRFVAIKVLLYSLSQNVELKTRFEREAQTLASL